MKSFSLCTEAAIEIIPVGARIPGRNGLTLFLPVAVYGLA